MTIKEELELIAKDLSVNDYRYEELLEIVNEVYQLGKVK